MNVVFVHSGGDQMASYRYRAAMPAEYLNAHGHVATINNGDADIVVFSKPQPRDISTAKIAKSEGTRVVVDFCDNHFAHETFGPVYAVMAEMADAITCCSEVMRNIVKDATGRDAEVIADPYEVEECAPHADGDKYLWFGHQRNLGEIVPLLKMLPVRVVTGPNNAIERYTPWSRENLTAALADSNVVILPTLRNDDYKSANRLINAVMAGCFVVSGFRPAHTEFRSMVWVGQIFHGLQWVKAIKDKASLVLRAQEHVLAHYSPDVIGSKWEEVLRGVA